MRKRDVIVACDFQSAEETLRFLDGFGARRLFVKVGMELYYSAGPDIVKQIKARGHDIFLDLKLHDIPNTVMRAMKVLAGLGVDMTNVHAAGGSEMMKAAREGAGNAGPLLIAVTQLTSTSEALMQKELLIHAGLNEAVAHYAKNAKESGLDGVVCSPLEAALVRETCGGGFLTVTPGIRYPQSGADDQQRVTTPEKARLLGSDYIVVGRPITAAADPLAAYERVFIEFVGEDR